MAKTTKTTTTTTTTTSSGGSSQPARSKFYLDSIQCAFFGQMFCAVILILAFTYGHRNSNFYGYGIAVAAIAIIFSFVALLLYSMKKDEMYGRALPGPSQLGSLTVGYLLVKFLVLWWFIAACIFTFEGGPFTQVGNGYFAVWGGCFFALCALGGQVSSLVTLSFCATILLIATPPFIGRNRQADQGMAWFCLLVAIITLIILLVIFYIKQPTPTVSVILFTALAIAWILLPFFVTFRGPHTIVGNGYFAAWVGAVSAFYTAAGAYYAFD